MPSQTRAKNTPSSLNPYTKKLQKRAHTNEEADALLIDPNKVLKSGAPENEFKLPPKTRRTLAQLRSSYSEFLKVTGTQ